MERRAAGKPPWSFGQTDLGFRKGEEEDCAFRRAQRQGLDGWVDKRVAGRRGGVWGRAAKERERGNLEMTGEWGVRPHEFAQKALGYVLRCLLLVASRPRG